MLTSRTQEPAAPQQLKSGLAAAVPVMLGYLPVAIAFGVLAVQSGLRPWTAVVMSLLVYAGASQFMAVNMLLAGAGPAAIVAATLGLNFRHFVMSMSLLRVFRRLPRRWRALLGCWLTDETFAVSTLAGRGGGTEAGRYYLLALYVASYLSWVGGTALGTLLSTAIPARLGSAMSIGLYAMFIALLVPAVRAHWRFALVAAAGAGVNAAATPVLGSGWSIVLATALGGAVGVFLLRGEARR